MRRAQATARSTGQNIERSLGGLSTRVSQSFAGIRVAANSLGLALGAGFLVAQARSAFEFAAGLGETARSVGVTVEQLQILRRAAIENGASVEGMERALSILNRTLGQARAGVPAAVQAFRALRIDPEQFTSAGQVLPRVMDAIRNLRTESEQAAAAQRLMGRGAAEMLPFLVQGARGYDQVAEAARQAGLITEEQARRADEASDKLALLAVTLRTNLASALVDLLPLIEADISAINRLAGTVANFFSWLGSLGGENGLPSFGSSFQSSMIAALQSNPTTAALLPLLALGSGGSGRRPGQVDIPIHDIPSTNTGVRDLDLSPRGGGGRRHGNGEAERKKALRDEHQFQSDLRREQITQLEEQRQRTNDYVEQNAIQDQIITLNRAQYQSDLDLRVALHDLTAEKENQLLAAYDQSDIQRRLTIASSEHENYVHEQATIAENEYNLARTTLQQQESMADTAEERRRIGLELLDLDYEYRRLKLQQIVRERNVYDEATRLDAQAQLDRMAISQRAERAGVIRNTRGPLEEYLAGLPTTAARAREALQSVAVNGLQSISDGLADIITGTRKWGDVMRDVAQRIIADLIKIQIEQRLIPFLANALGSIGGFGGGGANASSSWASVVSTVGSLPGRASGGPVLARRDYMVGEHGPEILRMGAGDGTIIPNGATGGGGIVVNQTFAPSFIGNAPTREEMLFLAGQVKQDTIDALRQMGRRR